MTVQNTLVRQCFDKFSPGVGRAKNLLDTGLTILEWGKQVCGCACHICSLTPHKWSLCAASPKARKHTGAARIDGPQLLSVYGRALEAVVDPLVVMGVHEAELYDPNEVTVLPSRCNFASQLNLSISLRWSKVKYNHVCDYGKNDKNRSSASSTCA